MIDKSYPLYECEGTATYTFTILNYCAEKEQFDGDVMVRVTSYTWMDPSYFCRCREREEVVQPHLFRGVHVS